MISKKISKKISMKNSIKISNLCFGIILALSACSSQPPAPVRGNKYQTSSYDNQPVAKGYYRVQAQDTLYRIALEHGQDYKDIIAWNNIENPNLIMKGQVLRVSPPNGFDNTTTVTNAVTNNAKVEVKSLANYDTNSATNLTTDNEKSDATTKKTTNTKDNVEWAWPTTNAVSAKFSDENKGMEFAGQAGDAILAAADGKVVYAGNGLRGYGELVIIKHNATYLTAYGHNRKIVVKEGQSVKRGQKIAEMGKTDADRVKLHFEIRKQGNPINPSPYLPTR